MAKTLCSEYNLVQVRLMCHFLLLAPNFHGGGCKAVAGAEVFAGPAALASVAFSSGAAAQQLSTSLSTTPAGSNISVLPASSPSSRAGKTAFADPGGGCGSLGPREGCSDHRVSAVQWYMINFEGKTVAVDSCFSSNRKFCN